MPKETIPNLAFITCIEKGKLEPEALLLYESIRRYGGRFSQCPIYAFSPRANHTISPATKQRLEALEVEYIDQVLNTELAYFAFANKNFATAYIEEKKQHEILVLLDNDTLFLREPTRLWLPDFIDVAVRPVVKRNVCTTGPNDPYDEDWQLVCQHCQVDYDRLPFIETSADQTVVKACYNGGLVVARANKGIFKRWLECVDIVLRKSKQQNAGQVSLSMAIWGLTDKVLMFDPSYNYPILPINQPFKPIFQVNSSEPLVHIHYFRCFLSQNLATNPLLQPNFQLEAEFKTWLLERIPLDNQKKLSADNVQKPSRHHDDYQTSQSLLEQARVQLNTHQNQEALKLLEQAIAVKPEMQGLHYGKALALARLGQTNEAISTLSQLLTTVPTYKKARWLLETLGR